MSKSTERAWASGVFDGEGSVWVDHGKFPSVRIGVGQSSHTDEVPELLLRFAQIVGVGAIRLNRRVGQSSGSTRLRHDAYVWRATSQPDVASVRKILWPYLGSVKRDQWIKAEQEFKNVTHRTN